MQPAKKHRQSQYGVITLCVLLLICLFGPVRVFGADSQIRTEFVSLTGVTLAQISQGSPGRGVLLYYAQGRPTNQPSLAVLFQSAPDQDEATARVYDDTNGNGYVDIKGAGNSLEITEAYPAIFMTSIGRWWVRNGIPNYNLRVQIFKPICAMWGAGPDCGSEGYLAKLKPGSPNFEIRTSDPEFSGAPVWDLRALVEPLPNLGVLRANYAERKCSALPQQVPSVSPEWPYIALEGQYEQKPGSLQPPIVVNWQASQTTLFSELVAVRAQSCGYNIYSISSIEPGKNNSPNFESPFAFYDLAEQGSGHSNLIIRTERFPAHDPWSVGINSLEQQNRTAPDDFQTIRYSWRNGASDLTWDYKVEVMGFQPYTATTTIGDGLATIDVPSYEEFPQWVIGRPWPVTTFIDTEGRSYKSSEGLYDWSPREVGIGYTFGWENARKQEAFTTIRQGLRGEYRSQRVLQPTLYVSPIDNRLHLLAAEGGLWSLNQNQALRLQNLSGGDYIDSWARLRVEAGQPVLQTGGEIEEQLAALGNFLIYSGASGIELRPYTEPSALLTTLPPTDQASWQKQRAALEAFTSAKRDPQDLKSWLAVGPAGGTSVQGAQIAELRAVGQGFRFLLSLPSGFQVQGDDLLGLAGLQSGSYAVHYDGAFHVEPLSLPILALHAPANGLAAEPAVALRTGQLHLQLSSDAASADAPAVAVRAEALAPDGQAVPIGERQVAALAGETIPVTFEWAPPAAGDWQIRVTAITTPTLDAPPMTAHFKAALLVAPAALPSPAESASAFGLVPLPALAGLLLAALLAAGLLGRYLLLPAAARRKL